MSVQEPSGEVADQTAPSGNGSGSASGNVERIREILFGPQIREYGERLARMEERLAQEAADLKAEVRRRLDSLEAYTRQEVKDLTERLRAERDERADSAERLSQAFGGSVKSLEKSLRESDERVSHALEELRELTLERTKGLVDDFTTQINGVQSSQNRQLEELRGRSVDRFVIATLLTELAVRIRGEFSMPGLGESHGNSKP